MSRVLVIPATTPPLFRGRKVSTQSPILHDLQAAAEGMRLRFNRERQGEKDRERQGEEEKDRETD